MLNGKHCTETRLNNNDSIVKSAILFTLLDNAVGPVLCMPIMLASSRGRSKLAGVIELCRKASEPKFGAEDEEIVQSYLAWAAIAFQSYKADQVPSSSNTDQKCILHESFLKITR